MRRSDVLDPAVAADLEALDAALAGAPDADPGLALFATELRELAPRPAAAFRSSLDARAARRFPRPARRQRDWGFLLKPLVGLAATAAVVALVVASPSGTGSSSMSSGGSSGASMSSEAAKATGAGGDRAAGGSTAGAGATGAGPVSALGEGRRVQRDVRLDLSTAARNFDHVTDAVVRTTQRAGGYVASSEISSSHGRGNATFELQVPVQRLDATVADLSRLAHVDNIEQASHDVTGEWDDLGRRLTDARVERRALVAALATATGDDAIRLRARLGRVTERLRSLEEQRRSLRAQTSYGTIELALTATPEPGAGGGSGGRWTPGDAWHDARRVVEVLAGVAIVVLAVLIPLAVAGAGVALGGRALRRRRREAALGSS
jgi:hypothetical protein